MSVICTILMQIDCMLLNKEDDNFLHILVYNFYTIISYELLCLWNNYNFTKVIKVSADIQQTSKIMFFFVFDHVNIY